MDKHLRDYIDSRYGEQIRSCMSSKDIEIIEKSFGFARFKAISELGETLDKLESMINPKLLKMVKFLNKVLKR